MLSGRSSFVVSEGRSKVRFQFLCEAISFSRCGFREGPTSTFSGQEHILLVHRLFVHQLMHQTLERPVRVHQLCLRADEVVRNVAHASKKTIFEDPRDLVTPIGNIHGEFHHLSLAARSGSKFRDIQRLLWVLVVHLFEILDRSILIGTVVVYAKVIRRIAGNPMHEIRDPCLTWRVTGTRRADELIAVPAKLHHLLEPDVCSLCRGYPGSFGLIEVVDDTVLCVFDVGPVAPGKLSQVMDHGPEWSPTFQLRRCPGVPLNSISIFPQRGT